MSIFKNKKLYILQTTHKTYRCHNFADALRKYINYDGGLIFLQIENNFYDKITNDWEVNAEWAAEGQLDQKELKTLNKFISQFSKWEMPMIFEEFTKYYQIFKSQNQY